MWCTYFPVLVQQGGVEDSLGELCKQSENKVSYSLTLKPCTAKPELISEVSRQPKERIYSLHWLPWLIRSLPLVTEPVTDCCSVLLRDPEEDEEDKTKIDQAELMLNSLAQVLHWPHFTATFSTTTTKKIHLRIFPRTICFHITFDSRGSVNTEGIAATSTPHANLAMKYLIGLARLKEGCYIATLTK